MEQEDLEWYQVEHSFMIFLLTIDALSLSPTLRQMLLAPVPSSIFSFCDRQRKQKIQAIRLL